MIHVNEILLILSQMCLIFLAIAMTCTKIFTPFLFPLSMWDREHFMVITNIRVQLALCMCPRSQLAVDPGGKIFEKVIQRNVTLLLTCTV